MMSAVATALLPSTLRTLSVSGALGAGALAAMAGVTAPMTGRQGSAAVPAIRARPARA